MDSAPSVRARLGAAALVSLCLLVGAGGARAQAALHGRVFDEIDGTPVVGATILLREVGLADSARSKLGGEPFAHRTATDEEGRYRLGGLTRGRYAITVDRFGYRSARLEVALDRDDPLSVSVLLEPVAFGLAPISLHRLRGGGPSLIEPGPGADDAPGPERTAAIRTRQRRFLSGDVRQLGHGDMRESNTLGEDDLFRALQTLPGVARRDDYTADLWTRGSPAGHTVVTFDGMPVAGALHALGTMAGLNSDMLGAATFQPGVVSASSQGAAAATIAVESRSPATGPQSTRLGVSPISARFTTDGRPSDRVAWAVGARRSHFDLWSALLDGLSPGGREFRYAFADLTGRADVALSRRSRIEVSGFLQDDRVFGEVAEVASGNEGVWGSRVARASLVTAYDGLVLRHTGGVSGFNASMKTAASDPAPTHPPTENHFRTLVWESRIAAPGAPEPWSLGLTVRRESYDYNGPNVGFASLLTPEELARRGRVDLTPLLGGLGQDRLRLSGDATRIALWGERRVQLANRLEMQAGLRVETGHAVQGDRARFAPRLLVRYRHHGAPVALSAGYGRSYQYTQSIGRTDVLRSGLRVSEVLAHAGDDTPALRSDLATMGIEAWGGEAWLFGVTGWLRETAGILTRQPTSGPLDQPRPQVGSVGTARGLDLSVRKLTGRVRGYANYGLSWAWLRTGDRTFEASENRRHVANLSVMTDARPTWQIGGTVRLESGAPFTRVTIVSTACRADEDCGDASPVLLGTTGGQRGPTFASVDLMTDWTHEFSSWSLSVYAQLRNVLGRSNAVTYHSSCLCVEDAAGDEGWLADHFDRGLPRLPVVGLRARF